MRILLVEDDKNVREALSFSLDSLGHNVRSAARYGAAKRELAAFEPDLLLCDWQLDDEAGDGVDLAREALAEPGTRVIMMTAREIPVLKQEAAGLPITAFLRKPLSLSDLLGCLTDE